MAINTGNIANLLRPGLKAIISNQPMYKPQWSEIFKSYDSDKQVEIEVEMRMLGLGQIRAEGAPTAMDTMGQLIITNYVHRYVALGFVITRQALVDNLYQTRFPMMATSLKESLNQSKELLGASVLVNAFNANFPIGDGQPLCSQYHPIDGGVYSNVANPGVDLNEASLEAAIVAVQQFKSQSGLILNTQPKAVLSGPANQFTMDRILNSTFRPGTANNDLNAIQHMRSVPNGFIVNQFLTTGSPGAWYLLTTAEDGLKHFVRESLETDVYADMDTSNIKCIALERYSFGASNARCIWGSNGP